MYLIIVLISSDSNDAFNINWLIKKRLMYTPSIMMYHINFESLSFLKKTTYNNRNNKKTPLIIVPPNAKRLFFCIKQIKISINGDNSNIILNNDVLFFILSNNFTLTSPKTNNLQKIIS